MSQAFTDTQLAAFLAGTIEDEALLDAIEAAINADPDLAERVARLGADDPAAAAVRDAFAPVLAADVPERLINATIPATTAKLVDFAAAQGGRRTPLPEPANDRGSGWRWPQFAAIAASLALGVAIGGPLMKGAAPGEGAGSGASLLLASADVTTMLDTAPSGQDFDLASLGTGQVVLTFRNTDKQLCRQFMVKDPAGGTSDALACAPGGTWQIEAYGRRAATMGEMKLAGGDAAPAVVAAVDAMIDSDPLLGKDEAAALGAK